MISTQQLELFDGATLKVLDANNTQFGLALPAIRMLVRQFGFNASETEMVDTLEYLTGKGLVKEVSKTLAKAFRNWKITDAGRQYLDENNL
ncbi:MAG TPA: hypothetical protein VH619_08865 [Verrucomicrobiae bacterium]|jgi:predicted RNA binding protein with dsRBD fold (UPF0201 family)|nr:hypothetical protein [Verrucomicrobiae bacterium]